jgi:hypothetical protein
MKFQYKAADPWVFVTLTVAYLLAVISVTVFLVLGKRKKKKEKKKMTSLLRKYRLN